MTYAIDDADGNLVTTGLQEHNARRIAQRIADARGVTVYLYAVGSDEDPDAIEPTLPEEDGQ